VRRYFAKIALGRALLAVLLALAVVVSWRYLRPGAAVLPAGIVVEDVVADLSRELDRTHVAREAADDPVRAGELRPGNRLDREGERPSLIAPPPASLRFPVEVPPGGVLRVSGGGRGARPPRPAPRRGASPGGVRGPLAGAPLADPGRPPPRPPLVR